MNWIDKTYKDLLGNRKFPDRLRQQGKTDLEKLLNQEMPVSPASSGKSSWFYGGIAALVIALVAVPAGLWFWQSQQGEMDSPAIQQLPLPPDQPEMKNNAPARGGVSSNPPEAEYRAAEATPETVVPADINAHQKTSPELSESRHSAAPITSDQTKTDREGDVKVASGKEVLNEFDDENSSKEINSVAAVDVAVTTASRNEIAEKPVNSNVETPAENHTDNTVIEKEAAGEESEKFISTEEKGEVLETEVQPDESVGEVPADKSTAVIQSPEEEEVEEPVDEEESNVTDEEAIATTTSKVTSAQLKNLSFSDFEAGEATSRSAQYKLLSVKRMAISLWGGYTYVGKVVKGGSEPYQEIRTTREDAIWATAMGVNFDYYLNSKWTFSVGVGWSEYGENINYEYQSTDSVLNMDGRYDSPRNYQNVTYLDSVRRIDSINVGHWEYDLAYTEEDTAIKNNNGQTRWTYIEIPLMVGYRFGTGRVKPWLQTGVSIGIPYATDFRYISPNGEGLQSVEDANSGIPSLQYSYLLSLGVDCYLSPHFSLRLNALGSYQINPSFKFSDIEQRYYRVGGTIGLAYNF